MERVYEKIKLHNNPTSEKSDMYESKMSWFENGKLEEFLLFLPNSKMALEALVTLAPNEKLLYIHT